MSPTYVYIAGYSRSGSTLLDIMLGSHPQVVGTGELAYLFDDFARADRRCSCGALYRDCPLWDGATAGRPSAELAAALRQVEQRRHLSALTGGNLPRATVQSYAAINTRLFAHIRSASGKALIVDSSKSARDAAGRPFAIDRYTDERIRVIHLVRELRATVASYRHRGSNWHLEGRRGPGRLLGERAMVGWTLANRIAADLGRRLGPRRYLRLDYEHLAGDPLGALSTLERFLDLDLEPVMGRVRAGDAFRAAHNVGGNRLRHGEVRPAAPGGPEELPWTHRAALPLFTRLGAGTSSRPGAREPFVVEGQSSRCGSR